MHEYGVTMVKNSKLDFKSVGELTSAGYTFVVDFYQRGYRWSADDVWTLVEDISSYDGAYFLQPIIVKRQDNPNSFELVDGQQRLTTLNLILDIAKPGTKFNLHYMRNADGSPNDGDNNLDKLFKKAASNKLKALYSADNQNLYEKLKAKLESVYFVIYDIGEASGYEIFNKINAGKIILADCELIKAFILYSMKNRWSSDEKSDFLKSWNTALNHVCDNGFYGFILGKRFEKIGKAHLYSRLDVMIAELFSMSDEDWKNAYPIFKVFESYVKQTSYDGIRTFIDEFRRLDERLYSAYKDDAVFHYVGAALSMNRAASIHELFCEYGANDTRLLKCRDLSGRNAFIGAVKGRIRNLLSSYGIGEQASCESIKDAISNWKKSESSKVRDLLLLHNVFIELNRHKRFSFYSFFNERWEIEHINPDTDNSDNKDFIKGLYLYLREGQSIPDEKSMDLYITERYKEIISENARNTIDEAIKTKAWTGPDNVVENIDSRLAEVDAANVAKEYFFKEYVTTYSSEDKQDLWNLVLLDKSTNAGIQNKFFLEKRNRVLANEKKGAYVLPGTAYAFMKAYSKSLAHPFQWDMMSDGNAYVDNIAQVIFYNLYKGGDSNE